MSGVQSGTTLYDVRWNLMIVMSFLIENYTSRSRLKELLPLLDAILEKFHNGWPKLHYSTSWENGNVNMIRWTMQNELGSRVESVCRCGFCIAEGVELTVGVSPLSFGSDRKTTVGRWFISKEVVDPNGPALGDTFQGIKGSFISNVMLLYSVPVLAILRTFTSSRLRLVVVIQYIANFHVFPRRVQD